MDARPEKPTACPSCGGPRVAEILYGLPHFTPELERALDEGQIVLGGCCVFGEDPRWQCADCGHSWGRLEWGDPAEESPA